MNSNTPRQIHYIIDITSTFPFGMTELYTNS